MGKCLFSLITASGDCLTDFFITFDHILIKYFEMLNHLTKKVFSHCLKGLLRILIE